MSDLRSVIIGNQAFCDDRIPGSVMVHACKWPCFVNNVGKPKPSDPDYLFKEAPDNLFLNMIDPDRPLFMIEMFWEFLEWASDRLKAGVPVVIHCNEGHSRAPSLGMILLARSGQIPDGSFDEARAVFEKQFTDYRPGMGITSFLAEHWNHILWKRSH